MDSIFEDDSLTQGQRLVWFAVGELATNGVSANNCAKIAGHMESSRAHVSRALKALHDAGWITRNEDVIQVHHEPQDRASDTRDRDSQARNRDSDTRNRDSHTRDRDSQARSDVSPQGKKKSSTKEKTQPPFDDDSNGSAPAREPRSGDGAPSVFDVEVDSVDAITEAAFGDPIRGLTVKDEIKTYCERAGPEGWDCLRSVCAMINRKGWNPTAPLVKKKLIGQLNLLNESDESDDKESDDFASQTQRLRQAARRGAGLDQ